MSNKPLSLTRRQFGLSLSASAAAWSAVPPAAPAPWMGPAIVRKVYLAKPQPTWPRPDLDFQQEIASIEPRLAEIERKHAGRIRFVGGELLKVGDEVSAWARGLESVDGVLVIDLTSGIGPLLQQLHTVDVPMLLFARPYSGWAYVDFAKWRQQGKRVELVASSEFGDLDLYMRVFETIHHLKRTKILVAAPGDGGRATAEAFTKQFGTSFQFISYQDIQAAYNAADVAQAKKDAEEFARRAVRVVEPSPQDITNAMRLYYGIKSILEREKANAITIDCLGGFRRGELPAYPCVTWSRLNDEGFYGVCEADLPATMTQILLTAFSGKPAFVSDPVFDTSRSELLHAHCVSATAINGIGGASMPYVVRSHMEDNKGVSLQVLVPVGEAVTVAKFSGAKKLLVSAGQVTGNVDADRGCRTKFRTRVAGVRNMLQNYSGGLHRVVVWGDYIEPLDAMSHLMGFQVVDETKA
ncbi:MAG: hypothetical protein ABFD60_17985 [Bryobacteraceae bacterium]